MKDVQNIDFGFIDTHLHFKIITYCMCSDPLQQKKYGNFCWLCMKLSDERTE